jgi:putative transposase
MMELVYGALQADESLSLSRLCGSASLSRATFYRRRGCEGAGSPGDTDLRDVVQDIAVEMPFYGYRRITEELRRRGYAVNHKRGRRIMRDDNLLCVRRRKFVCTTDSGHGLPVYPNLARDMSLSGIDQLWVADITYIRLHREFVYLAVILDAYSRRCVGWSIGRRLDDSLSLEALRMALAKRGPAPGLVHHSDRGVQYASKEYTDLLKEHGIAISMSRTGNPYDNAYAESFIKTLKYEEVYLSEYESLADARASIEHFIEEVYNRKRLHSSLGYMPPEEFEMLLEGTSSLN